MGGDKPNPDKPVVAKRKSRFIGELKIEDLWYSTYFTSTPSSKKHVSGYRYPIWRSRNQNLLNDE
jgi:hypothetical protein